VVDEITVDKKFSFLDESKQPYIYDVTTGLTVKLSKKGEDPHGIMIPYDFRYPKEKICIKDAYDEFNIPLSLMKTSLTGEFDYSGVNGYITAFAWVLLISGAVLALICLAGTVHFIIKGRGKQYGIQRLYLGIIYVTAIVFYLNLALGIPNFSSQERVYTDTVRLLRT
jgi:hypothetical protein